MSVSKSKIRGRTWPVVSVSVKEGKVQTKSPISFRAELRKLFNKYRVKGHAKLILSITDAKGKSHRIHHKQHVHHVIKQVQVPQEALSFPSVPETSGTSETSEPTAQAQDHIPEYQIPSPPNIEDHMSEGPDYEIVSGTSETNEIIDESMVPLRT